MDLNTIFKNLQAIVAVHSTLKSIKNPTMLQSQLVGITAESIDVLRQVSDKYEEALGYIHAFCKENNIESPVSKEGFPTGYTNSEKEALIKGMALGVLAVETGMVSTPEEASTKQKVNPMEKVLNPETMDDMYISEAALDGYTAELG